jgi:hypothetical protein
MDYDLRQYVKLYDGFLDPPMCNFAVSDLIARAQWKDHQFYNSQTKELNSTENELSVSYSDIPIRNIINERLWFALERYILNDFAKFNWWNKWNGYAPVRFNRYSENTDMKLHCDHIHSLFDGKRQGVPILSMVGLLNDDFEGGEFIMWDGEVIPMSAGSLLIFPSNFMFPHRVNSVTAGTRYSFVSWSW